LLAPFSQETVRSLEWESRRMDAQRDEEATSKGHADWRRAAMHGVLTRNEK